MGSTVEPLHLLRTKFYRPRTTGDLIRRERVRQTLDRNLNRALTLVCAPAGFGKTVLLSDWLATSALPSAWLSLDSGDSDLTVFLSYFVAAVRTLFPAACGDTLALLQAPMVPPLNALVTALTNDLDALGDDPGGQHFVLVLDDYHLVQGQAVHALLSELFRHPPRTLHLVMVTRQDPPFPLHALRARDELGEIRTPELRFTQDEVAAFMHQALGEPLDAAAVTTLCDRTEGWATGLRLAALTLNAGGDVAGPDLAVDNRFVLDYLLNEVLARVPTATEGFLLRTSIVDRLCGSLCDAIAGPSDPTWDGRAYLEWLAGENLFTFALDTQGAWYRYHHLFQKLLRTRLERQVDAQSIAELHARASAWFARHDMIDEAIEHALAAGDKDAAVRLVERHRHQALNREHWRQLERWLSLAPRQLIDARPELLMLEAWILQKQWRFVDIPPYVDRIETLMQDVELPEADRVRLVGEIHALRALTAYYVHDVEPTCLHAERALNSIPLECSFVRAVAWFYFAGARQMTGDIEGAVAALREGLKEDRLHGNAFTTRLYTGLAMIHWMNADLQQLVFTARQMLQLAEERDLVETMGWGHYFMGCALYQTNDLAGAEREFGAVVKQRYLANAYTFSQSSFGLAAVYRARGDIGRARDMIESLAAYALETHNTRIMNDTEAFRACLALEAGHPAEALRWAQARPFEILMAPLSTFHVALMTQSQILIRAGTAASLAQADQILTRLRQIVETTHNNRFLIDVLVLQALLIGARGERGAAAPLERGLALAEPGGLLRVFADAGPGAAHLLRQTAGRGGPAPFVAQVLDALGEVETAGTVTGRPPAAAPFVDQTALIEPLSERELEVLALLAERLINKEIARELGISPMTVKRHTVNIYQKLAVSSRRDAVARAYALGILPLPQPPRRRG